MFDTIWYGHSWLRWLLWPFSLIYRLAVFIKAQLYRWRILKITTFDVPVIVVGNISVGGTGKTPFCIALCEYLKSQGYQPGLVSRGFGGRATTWPQNVDINSDPNLVGDEAVLLVTRTQCPMVVAPNRVAAVTQLLQTYDCDVVISDDGLQHYRMGRAMEIILLDSVRGLGNGLCLPAGPLRESAARLKTVDWVVENGSTQMHIKPGAVYALLDLQKTMTPSDTQQKRVCAIAGIGHPQRFFDTLSNLGFKFTTKTFADHYAFKASTLKDIKADIIIMTQKDAVKCRRFADSRCYALPITACIDEKLLTAISAKL